MTHPLISVIIPSYNAANFLPDALESIEQQNYQPLEIIVIDDGSTDNTADVIKQWKRPVHYLYQQNAGAGSARNRGLTIAQGEFITFLDADDLWTPNRLIQHIQYFEHYPEIEAIVGKVQVQKILSDNTEAVKFEDIGIPSFIPVLGATIYRRSVFTQLGTFDAMRFSEDVDWYLRVHEAGIRTAVIDTVLLYYRIHHHNTIHDRQQSTSGFLKALKKSLDRRRLKNPDATMPEFNLIPSEN